MKRRTMVGIALMIVGCAALGAAVFLLRQPPDEEPLPDGKVMQPGPVPGKELSILQASGTCRDCRDKFCRDYLGSGVDIIAGRFEQAHKSVTNPDPKFVEDYVAVVKCAYDHNCGYKQMPGPFECYCGSVNPT